MRVLVYLAHPRPDRSEINLPMFDIARRMAGVTAVDLYADYPGFEIDIDREQARLTDHDAVIFQHPLYWYAAPAILKEWQDLVLEYGFAYGHDGHALDGKLTLNAVTCGARADAYHPGGANGAYLRDLLLPFEKTAGLCRMRYLAPFVLYAAGRAGDEGRAAPHLAAWAALLTALHDGKLDLGAASGARELNALIPALPEEA